MSVPKVIEAGHRSPELFKDEIRDGVEAGKNVVVNFGDANVDPERITKTLDLSVGDADVNLKVRHAELQEYFRNAATGAAAGGALGTGYTLISAVMTGNPVSLTSLLAVTGLGMAAGAALGATSTPIAEFVVEITVYKYGGETRMKYHTN